MFMERREKNRLGIIAYVICVFYNAVEEKR